MLKFSHHLGITTHLQAENETIVGDRSICSELPRNLNKVLTYSMREYNKEISVKHQALITRYLGQRGEIAEPEASLTSDPDTVGDYTNIASISADSNFERCESDKEMETEQESGSVPHSAVLGPGSEGGE